MFFCVTIGGEKPSRKDKMCTTVPTVKSVHLVCLCDGGLGTMSLSVASLTAVNTFAPSSTCWILIIAVTVAYDLHQSVSSLALVELYTLTNFQVGNYTISACCWLYCMWFPVEKHLNIAVLIMCFWFERTNTLRHAILTNSPMFTVSGSISNVISSSPLIGMWLVHVTWKNRNPHYSNV